MLDQDTPLALLTVADECGARVALVGDRHQLPAVGRGGVLDLATDIAPEKACLTLDTVHRFADPEYADLTLLMRTGHRPGEVFDELHARGEVEIHRTDVERLQRLADLAASPAGTEAGQAEAVSVAAPLVVADTREQVAAINAAVRDLRVPQHRFGAHLEETDALLTRAGEQIGVGDTVATRRNDQTLGVTNRQTWTVAGLSEDGGITVVPSALNAVQNQAGTKGGNAPFRRSMSTSTSSWPTPALSTVSRARPSMPRTSRWASRPVPQAPTSR